MMARYWTSWATVEDADAYEGLLKNRVLPGLNGIEEYRGGCGTTDPQNPSSS